MHMHMCMLQRCMCIFNTLQVSHRVSLSALRVVACLLVRASSSAMLEPTDQQARRCGGLLLGFPPVEEAEFRLRVFSLCAPMSVFHGSVSFCFAVSMRAEFGISAYTAIAAMDAAYCLIRIALSVSKKHAVAQRLGVMLWLTYFSGTVIMEALQELSDVDRPFGDTDTKNLATIAFVVKAFGMGLVHGLQGMSQRVIVLAAALVMVALLVMIGSFKRMKYENEGPMIVTPGVLGLLTSLLLEQALRKGFEWELGGRAALLQRMERLQRENEQGTELVEEVQKARGFDRELMMAMTFHEVRNPLNGTVGHLRLAKQLVAGMRRGDVIDGNEVRGAIGGAGYGEDSEGDRSALRALEEEVDQSIVATDLAVQYLGTLATLHGALTGSRELVLAPTELRELVRSAAAVVRPQLQPGVELRVEVPEAETHVVTDGLMLMQVLLNLMQNAARFTKQGFVCVRCSVEQAPGGELSAKFAVLDSGSGLSDATKATLFDLYSSVGGIGLGMFLSAKLLSLLGSKIEVESPWRSDGPGAAFYFTVDVVPAAASGSEMEPDRVGARQTSLLSEASPGRVTRAVAVQEVQISIEPSEEDPAETIPGQEAGPYALFEPNLRVLIADDGLTNRRLLRRAFTGNFGQGWLVTEATSAEEALTLAIETEFALIVMDEIFAPGLEAMRGSAAIMELRAHEAQAGARRRAVVVSCTGNAGGHKECVDLKKSGADLVWGKPMPNFTNNEMQNQLAPYLAASRTRAQPHATET